MGQGRRLGPLRPDVPGPAAVAGPVALPLVLQHLAGDAVDGVLMLAGALPEVHVVFQPAVVVVPVHGKAGDVLLLQAGVGQGRCLGPLRPDVPGPPGPVALLLVLPHLAGGRVHRVLILGGALPEIYVVLQAAVVVLPVDLHTGGILLLDPGVGQRRRFGGFRPNVPGGGGGGGAAALGVGLLFVANHRAGSTVDDVVILIAALPEVHVVFQPAVVVVLADSQASDLLLPEAGVGQGHRLGGGLANIPLAGGGGGGGGIGLV